jgi:hypothetical protein
MLWGKNLFVGVALCIAAGSAATLGYLLFSTTLNRDTYFWGRLLLGAVSILAAWASIVAAGGFKRHWKAWFQPQSAAAIVVAIFSAFGVAVDSLSLMVPGAAVESRPRNIETMVRELLERGPRCYGRVQPGEIRRSSAERHLLASTPTVPLGSRAGPDCSKNSACHRSQAVRKRRTIPALPDAGELSGTMVGGDPCAGEEAVRKPRLL